MTEPTTEVPGRHGEGAADARSFLKDQGVPPATRNEARLRGDRIRTAPHESEPGHVFRLARELNSSGPNWDRGEEGPHRAFPQETRTVPVPDLLLGQMDDLSGVAVRCALLLIRKAYQKRGRSWTCSPRAWTAEELAGDRGLGLCRESLRRGMRELAARGWADVEGEQSLSYRWTLDAPQERFTPLPLPVVAAQSVLSPSALTLLLGIYRATWGWTDTRTTDAGEEVTVHRRHERLSMEELRHLTGLSAPTVRASTEELRRHKAIVRARPHRGSAWYWRPSRTFIRNCAQKIWGGTSRERKSNNTHTREADPNGDPVGPTQGVRRRKTSAPTTRGDLSEEWKRRFFDVWTDQIGMTEAVALHYLHTRGRKQIHESTLAAVRRKRADLDDPASYAHTALENLWHASIQNKQPDVRQSSGEAPLAQAFDALTNQQEGWEWDSGEQGGAGGPEEGGSVVADVETRIGITHDELKSAVEALKQPPGDWTPVGECPVLFVPDKELARWCWHHEEELKDDAARRWAARLVQVRADFDGIDLDM